MDCARTEVMIVDWLKQRLAASDSKGFVFGLSGGLDSALVASLAVKAAPGACLGLIMPCDSNPLDAEHAILAAEAFGLGTRVVDLSGPHRSLLSELRRTIDGQPARLAAANLKPRLRMASLYFFSNELNLMVLGTGNRSEWYVGYSTKYGDGGVDLQPIIGLTKTQARQLSRHMGVPEEIILKAPTAGLWQGQTDEGEMGFTYEQLDEYITTGRADAAVKDRIDRMHAGSRHKFVLPPTPIDPGSGI